MSKKGSAGAPTTADSVPSKNAVNAERAARHARRLNKASSQGAQPPTPTYPVDEVHKVLMNAAGDDVIRRKAGSGTRVEGKVADQSSYAQLSQALVNQKTGSSFFVSKHSFVKAAVPKRMPANAANSNKINDI